MRRVREEKRRRKKIKEEKVRRKKMQVRQKVPKSRNTVVPMICGSRGLKSKLPKAEGAEPSGQMRDEELHADVARSTFVSENATNISRPEASLEVEMWKKCMPFRCEASFEVKCAKHIKTH